ncbi:hypothetical protein VMCG_05465 [Cytospora schulzeri]|uniref:Uncharacterized protein n=1 Tax=Cytospora schulzeri TaxID=448051 RepID=A0A423WKS0_9PEZI|nr:hypothetical protein VMCG_05465 [Valsa malicola]
MFAVPMLPDLTPRDSHNLWYTSRHGPSPLPQHLISPHDPSSTTSSSTPHDAHPSNDRGHPHHNHNHHGGHHHHPSRDRRALLERTPLARLRFEEQLMERRRLNVSNFGSAWLKPPGVPKTLFQMREERREAEEHAEALRREQQLAAELAEAGAEGQTTLGEEGEDLDEPMMGGGGGGGGEEEGMGEEQPDLDDDIPEAEGFGFDGEDDSEDEEETVEMEEEGEEDTEEEDGSFTGTGHAGVVQVSPAERRDMREQVRDMRAAEDRVREVMARGQEGGGLVVDDDLINGDDGSGMLEEDDLVHEFDHDVPGDAHPGDSSMDMDMDADLDGDIPEADGGYEHTDSDAELSEDGTHNLSFAGTARNPQASRFRRSLPRSSLRGSQRASLAQSEFDISGLLSQDGSSYMEGSPHMRRRGG